MGYSVLILQQSEWYRPGKLLLQAARDNNIKLHVTKVWKESAADFADFDALVILGGPFRIDQDDQYPFLREEKRLVRAWINLNKPCLGFNLGQHLLAEAAGATIGPGYVRNTGFIDGHLTHEGRRHPLFQGVHTPFPLFKWHVQEIQSPLPRNMVLLATSKDCMAEACCLVGRSHIIGLQCDNYAGAPEDVALWIEHDREVFTPGKNPTAAAKLIETANGLTEGMAATFGLLMRNFVAMLK
jgi:GMP synthase-like glutamine amidotransferase